MLGVLENIVLRAVFIENCTEAIIFRSFCLSNSDRGQIVDAVAGFMFFLLGFLSFLERSYTTVNSNVAFKLFKIIL